MLRPVRPDCTLFIHSQNTHDVLLHARSCTMCWEGWPTEMTWSLPSNWVKFSDGNSCKETLRHFEYKVLKLSYVQDGVLKHRKILPPILMGPVLINSVVPVVYIYFGTCHAKCPAWIQERSVLLLHPKVVQCDLWHWMDGWYLPKMLIPKRYFLKHWDKGTLFMFNVITFKVSLGFAYLLWKFKYNLRVFIV